MSSEIQPYNPGELSDNLDQFSTGLSQYLGHLGLPSESILVEIDERKDVVNNMPSIVLRLTENQRNSAMYISKFAAACVVGLFDAALNYLWDETIRNLRVKIVQFDLDYFYDTAVTDSNQRLKLKDESDLEKLDDWVIVRGCRETGIISDIGYKHLDYIRDMRNHASAAHPNQNELTGLQLASWLQTCIREVLSKEPEEPAIQVKRFLQSLRNESLSQSDISPIESAVVRLPEDLSHSLLRTIFGMYTDPKLDSVVRNNIRLVALAIWQVCAEDSKYEIGLKRASFSANGEVSRADLAREFLQIVDGLAYLSPETIAVEITGALDALLTAHGGWNNFHNEPSHARILKSFIPSTGNIPNSVASKYVKILTMCRIGNGYGVSSSAEPIYDDLISRWRDIQITSFINLINDSETISRLQLSPCRRNYRELSRRLLNQAADPNVKLALEFIVNFSQEKLDQIKNDSRFRTILKTVKK